MWPIRVSCSSPTQACGRQTFAATSVTCAVVVASTPSKPSSSVTASHGSARSKRVSQGKSHAVRARAAIARKT